jgi:hypothetical protein
MFLRKKKENIQLAFSPTLYETIAKKKKKKQLKLGFTPQLNSSSTRT